MRAARLSCVSTASPSRFRNICCRDILITGHITVIAPDGRVVRQVKMPDVYPTNICFGGNDMKTAYITLSGIEPARRDGLA
jgi:sugar lactone lactonase YvrE